MPGVRAASQRISMVGQMNRRHLQEKCFDLGMIVIPLRMTATLVGIALALQGCQDDVLLGMKGVHNVEPLFTVREVTNSVTQAPLDEIRIGGFKHNGYPYALEDVLFPPVLPTNVLVSGNEIVCAVPCRFGVQAGHWEMVFKRAGFRDTVIALDADYERKKTIKGDVTLWGPTILRVRMTPTQ